MSPSSCLSTALVVMPANNSRNTKSCLTAVNTDTDSDSVICVELPKCWNYFALLVFFSNTPPVSWLTFLISLIHNSCLPSFLPCQSISLFFSCDPPLTFSPPLRSGVSPNFSFFLDGSVGRSVYWLVGWNCWMDCHETLCRFPGDEFSYGDSLTFHLSPPLGSHL